jgi:hypothetical protein
MSRRGRGGRGRKKKGDETISERRSCEDKRRKTSLTGCAKTVDRRTYCEHLEDMRDNSEAFDLDSKRKCKLEDRSAASNVRGWSMGSATVDFDDDAVSKLNVGDLLDHLSDEDEEIEYWRDNLSFDNPDDDGWFTRKEKERLERVAKGKKVPLSSDERQRYREVMASNAWHPTSEETQRMKRDMMALGAFWHGSKKIINPAQGGEDKKTSEPGCEEEMIYF